jgi:two-component system, chemotaxis family, protein-glutamate methylesterase/glutaminase
MRPIRLLIVDDSGFMRMAVRKMVDVDTEIQVIGEARNGVAAIQMVRDLKPDVVTMDIEMPDMDGLTATRKIMAERPTPIIMLSSLTQKGAQVTVEALSAGAVDFISKSSSFVQLDIVQIDKELREKIRYWGRRTCVPGVAARSRDMSVASPISSAGPAMRGGLRTCPRPKSIDMVVVGVSTGGPRMFPLLLKACGKLACPMVVAQHMPEFYTSSFATHLHQETGLDVREGQDGVALLPGEVIIIPGGKDGALGHGIGGKKVFNVRCHADAPIHPNADVLFESALRVCDSPLAVLLTGMGSDGTRGAVHFAEKGLPVMVQTPESCVVGGMPQSAMDAGAVSHVLSIEEIGNKLRDWCSR